jgi:hypothetical protein
MDQPEFVEWLMREQGGMPPYGMWVVAGKQNGVCGVFWGEGQQVRDFYPEDALDALVQRLRRDGETQFAQAVENVRADVADLREGRKEVVADLGGKLIPDQVERQRMVRLRIGELQHLNSEQAMEVLVRFRGLGPKCSLCQKVWLSSIKLYQHPDMDVAYGLCSACEALPDADQRIVALITALVQ